MATGVPSLAEFVPVDTRARSGTIVLPAVGTTFGRVLTFKDMFGSFAVSSLTLTTAGGNTFDDNSTSKVLRDTYGYVTLISNGATRWNVVDGTIFPMYTFSTLVNSIQINTVNSNSISTNLFFTPISSLGLRVSTIGFQDQLTRLNIPLFSRSTILYYGTTAVAGTRAGTSQPLPVVPI